MNFLNPEEVRGWISSQEPRKGINKIRFQPEDAPWTTINLTAVLAMEQFVRAIADLEFHYPAMDCQCRLCANIRVARILVEAMGEK